MYISISWFYKYFFFFLLLSQFGVSGTPPKSNYKENGKEASSSTYNCNHYTRIRVDAKNRTQCCVVWKNCLSSNEDNSHSQTISNNLLAPMLGIKRIAKQMGISRSLQKRDASRAGRIEALTAKSRFQREAGELDSLLNPNNILAHKEYSSMAQNKEHVCGIRLCDCLVRCMVLQSSKLSSPRSNETSFDKLCSEFNYTNQCPNFKPINISTVKPLTTSVYVTQPKPVSSDIFNTTMLHVSTHPLLTNPSTTSTTLNPTSQSSHNASRSSTMATLGWTNSTPATTYSTVVTTDYPTIIKPILKINLVDAKVNEKNFLNLAKNVSSNLTVTKDQIKVKVMVVTPSKTKHTVISKPFQSPTASVDSIDINPANHSLKVVIVRFPSSQIFEQNEIDKNTKYSEFLSPNLTLLSVSVFDSITYKKIQAKVSYTIFTSYPPDFVAKLFPLQSEGYWSSETIVQNVDYVCNYFNSSRGGTKLSKYGCKVLKITGTKVECYCSHTTIYAALLSVGSFTIPSQLKLLSFVAEITSVLFLILTILVLCKVRKHIRNDRTIVQINLALSLLLLHLVSLLSDVALRFDRLCEMIAILVHYFFLVSGLWMCIEAVSLAIKTSNRALRTNSRRSKQFQLVLGWGIPALIVIASVVVGFKFNLYMSRTKFNRYKKCWIKPKSLIIYAGFLGPLVVIYLINIIVFCNVLVFVTRMSLQTKQFKATVHVNDDDKTKSESHFNHVKATLKSFAMLFPILGISYIFLFLSGIDSYEASIIFMYLNVIFSGFQGVYIFLVYCILGSEVRITFVKRMKKKLSWWSMEKQHRFSLTNMTSLSNSHS